MAAKKKPTKTKRTRPGLGRGLGALIADKEEPAPKRRTPSKRTAAKPSSTQKPPPDGSKPEPPPRQEGAYVSDVNTALIKKSPWQPRRVFDEDALRELTDSIRSRGIIQPLLVRKVGNEYELIAGERRLRAATDAGLSKVPVILMDAADRDAAEVALIENLQREDLNIIEEAEGYRSLAEQFSMTQQEVADCVGKARASVTNSLRLLELPDEVKQMLGGNQLSAGHAKTLLALEGEENRIQLARRSITEQLSVRALEKLVTRLKSSPKTPKAIKPDMPRSHVTYISDLLHTHFGTSVRISPSCTYANGKRGKGSLEIDFFSNDDLDRILEILGVTLN